MIPKILDRFEEEIGALPDCIEGISIEERNGMCEAEITYPIFSLNWNKLQRGNIIVADVNDTLKNQKFRIYKASKPLSGKIKVYARHIFFDLARDIIEEFELTNASCEYALNELFRRSQFSQAFKGYSDIINAQDYKMSTINLIKAIGGVQGSILDTYGTGAEILRDNRNIHVLNRRGHDNGVTIEYSKNMTGLNIEFDDSNLITRIKAIAKYNDENNNEIIVKSNPEYVDSPLLSNYETPFISEIDFSQEFENDAIPTPTKLRELAEKYFRDNKCDQVKTNIKVEFIPLSKCVGYEDIQDKISLCDTVTIKDYRYNLDTQAKVIKTHYNFLNDRYEKMELGDPKVTLGNLVGGGNYGPGITGEETSKVPGINDSSFPNTLPTVPVLSSKLYGFDTIELSWTFEAKTYYTYELYASKVKDFEPSVFDLLFKGNASTFLHSAKPSETWYYRVRAINTHGKATAFSNQISVETVKIENLENYVANAAIGDALIGELNLGRGWFGQLRGNYIDAKQLSVTDGNGKRTLDIDSFGNVTLLPKNFKILVDGKEESVISQSSFNIALDKINLSIKTVEEKTSETNKSLIELGDNMNGAFKDGVLDEAEKQSIKNNLSALNAEKQNFIAQADGILKNSELLNTAESIKINDAKANFINTHYKLINKINSILGKAEVDNMRIHFIDTQVSGDCILIQYNNKNILVDSNEAECSDKIIKYLKNLGVSNLDYIIATHHHSDHSGGFPDIIQSFNTDGCVAYHRTPDWSKMPAVEEQWDTKGCHDRFINACNLKGISIKTPTENERIVLSSDTYIEFYNTSNTDYNNYNNLSLCTLIVHKNKKYFLSGDIYIEGQAKLASSLSKVDIYKSQHHDYDEKMNDTYFNKLNPTECIMTLFTIHGDGRPKSLSGRCQYNNIPYYYTHGTIILESDGTSYTLSTSNNYLYKDKWWNKDNNGDWYYFKYNGDYAKNESIEIDGTLYNFNSTGLCTNPNGRV